MKLQIEPYLHQQARWPKKGRVILAQYDANSIIVYQAYRPAIGRFASKHGYFGGEFKLSRMTWIKPNFLWMMYRSGWGAKEGQEVLLAIRLWRSAFDSILALAVDSTYNSEVYENHEAWNSAVNASEVRLQWDPDHGPSGDKLERRAIQLGLRGDAIRKYSRDWIVSIEDISEFVAQQRQHVLSKNYEALLTPTEYVYEVTNLETARKLGIAEIVNQ